MSAVRFGLKLWSTNTNLLPSVVKLVEEGFFHYIELNPVPGTEITPFLDYDVHYVIHITTERHGVNIADPDKRLFNLKTINECLFWADRLSARYCILHPGFGTINDALDFLTSLEDRRILIENMPKTGIDGEHLLGYTPEQIIQLMDEKFGFCLDINHAIKAAVSLHEPYKEGIRKFLRLHPRMFHIADGSLSTERDEHLHIGRGNYDFSILHECCSEVNSPMITLETPRNPDWLNDDLMNRKAIMPYLM